MPIYRSDPRIRPAGEKDHAALTRFLNHEYRIHRHLDWRSPLEWLGSQPYLIAEQEGLIQAVFSCPPDPPQIAWIRLFGAAEPLSPAATFKWMLAEARSQLEKSGIHQIVAIGLQPWFQTVLSENGFYIRQSIVVLEWTGQIPPETSTPGDLNIRPMVREDLQTVAEVDQVAFDPIWQNSLESLTLAYQQSSWSTVAETPEGIIGYQISTSIPLTGHLARLAVLPALQRRNIGYALVRQMLKHFQTSGAWHVTVNTQDDNLASIALYEKMGFRRTGEIFPVYQLA